MIEYSKRVSIFSHKVHERTRAHHSEIIWVPSLPEPTPWETVTADGWRLAVYPKSALNDKSSVVFSMLGPIQFKREASDVYGRKGRVYIKAVGGKHKSMAPGTAVVPDATLADQLMYEAMLKRIPMVKAQSWDMWIRREVRIR